MGVSFSSQFSSGTWARTKTNLIIMNPLFVATLAIIALSAAEATIIIGTAVAGTAVTLSASTVATLALLGAAAARGKRSAVNNETDDSISTVLNIAEPAQCYRRLICDMAAGAIPDHDKILSLFNSEVSPVSPKFEYVTAAKVGEMVRNA